MTVTQAQLDDFHQFASEYIQNCDNDLTIDDLLIEWDSVRNRSEINSAIREGLTDINAGRTRPAADVVEDIRRRYNVAE